MKNTPGGLQTGRWTLRLLFSAFALLALFAFTGQALAHAPHASPFTMHAQAMDDSRPHCLLHQHKDFQTPCPHERAARGPARIGPECGGSPAGHVPASSVSQHNPGVEESLSGMASPAVGQAPGQAVFTYDPPLHPSPAPPPKRISLI